MSQDNRSSFDVFEHGFLDPEAPLIRIGEGELGGKAHGLVHIREVLNTDLNMEQFPGITLDIPPLAVIGTGVFDAFIKENNLHEVVYRDHISDEDLTRAFLESPLPAEVLTDLRALVEQVHTPLAVRSSSLLEDARYEPFAGVYATKMIPNKGKDTNLRLRQLVEAIKFVYASTFFRHARNYRRATGHTEEEESMAVVIQKLVGKHHGERFYPEISGVARSYNYYPVGRAKPEEGVVYLALGLGKTIVDGEPCWMYSPAHPKVEPPFGSVEKLLKETQTDFWVLNMGEPLQRAPTSETEYLLRENLTVAEQDGVLRYLASTYSPLSGRLSIGTGFPGPRALTFAPILVLEEIPLNRLLVELLEICQHALGAPVEIEFAMTLNPHRFALLQVRSMLAPTGETRLEVEDLRGEHVLVATENAMGNGTLETIRDVVYVRPENFELRYSARIAPELERINERLVAEGRPYLLIVLGRLGTSDPWLGIPVRWAQISGACAVVEATGSNVRVELSRGSHFFHNIVSLGVKYLMLSSSSRYTVDWEWLDRQEGEEETEFVRHVRLPNPLQIRVDGYSGRGVIYKPADL
ncbi:MAG: hypothetical protein D6770_10050 [Anaerolineae bacterium]|nr:MAG: hypothetical protein D6770_10050 [Anaerolineae bacterium]